MKRQGKDFAPHLERYVFTLPYIQRRDVLDAGSKSGFGAHIMEYTAKSVTLVDISKTFLNEAKKYNHFCPAKFIESDFNKEFPEGTWNAIVAFEIIEHVEDPEFFIKNISEHLSEDGVFIFSVPHMKDIPDHITLFDETKIKKLISRYFKIEEFYIQDTYGISNKQFKRYPKTYVGVATK